MDDQKEKPDLDLAVSIFNSCESGDRKEMIYKILDTFEDDEKAKFIEEINTKYIALRYKYISGKELPLTHQLLIQHDASTYMKITTQLEKQLSMDAKLLDDLITICNFWHVDECTSYGFAGMKNIIFSINPCCRTHHDRWGGQEGGRISATYKIVDVVTFMADIKKEGIRFWLDKEYFADDKGIIHTLHNTDKRMVIHKLAREKRSTLKIN